MTALTPSIEAAADARRFRVAERARAGAKDRVVRAAAAATSDAVVAGALVPASIFFGVLSNACLLEAIRATRRPAMNELLAGALGIAFVAAVLFFFLSIPAALVGAVVGRLLARFQHADSEGRLIAQGALFGGACVVLLFAVCATPFARTPPAGADLGGAVVSALLAVAWGAACGGAAGRAVAREGKRASWPATLRRA
jgi:hypothetical protein